MTWLFCRWKDESEDKPACRFIAKFRIITGPDLGKLLCGVHLRRAGYLPNDPRVERMQKLNKKSGTRP